jgi:predicted metalloprotease with PDZ domain
VPYELPEVEQTLRELTDFDWEGFFARRTARPHESLPLDVVARCGYRLGYATEPSAYLLYSEHGTITARDSLGLSFSGDGRILDVVPGMIGDKSGLAPGMKVIGVNGRTFNRQRLRDALADSIALRKVELLLIEGDRFRTIILNYTDGPRYLELVRDSSKPDILAEVLKPSGGRAQ